MTQKFRNKKPVRRKIEKIKDSYKSYRKELREDFYNRCGYCDNPQFETMETYHIDHFAPQEKFKASKWATRLNAYENLVFSCPHCNILKSDTWISDDMDEPNKNGEGFVCPCSDEYDNLFIRNTSGEIVPQNSLGEYMYNELKFHLIRFSLIWKMEKLSSQIDEMKKLNNDSLKPIIGEIALEYTELLNEFKKAKKIKKY